MFSNKSSYKVDTVGCFTPKKVAVDELTPGEVGFITASIKEVADCNVGDTIYELGKRGDDPFPGFKPSLPVVFCGLFPVDAGQFDDLKEALAKLKLHDASLSYEMENSAALGLGFDAGSLVCCIWRLFRSGWIGKYDLDLITTSPSVNYHLTLTDGSAKEIHNPADLPDVQKIETWEEPWVLAHYSGAR